MGSGGVWWCGAPASWSEIETSKRRQHQRTPPAAARTASCSCLRPNVRLAGVHTGSATDEPPSGAVERCQPFWRWPSAPCGAVRRRCATGRGEPSPVVRGSGRTHRVWRVRESACHKAPRSGAPALATRASDRKSSSWYACGRWAQVTFGTAHVLRVALEKQRRSRPCRSGRRHRRTRLRSGPVTHGCDDSVLSDGAASVDGRGEKHLHDHGGGRAHPYHRWRAAACSGEQPKLVASPTERPLCGRNAKAGTAEPVSRGIDAAKMARTLPSRLPTAATSSRPSVPGERGPTAEPRLGSVASSSGS